MTVHQNSARDGGENLLDRKKLIDLLTAAALERAAERLRAEAIGDRWPEDLQARDIVRLLRGRSPEIVAIACEEGDK